jgi:DnaK suppressor protein
MADSEKTRYSDAELQEFREIINAKLVEAKEDLDLLNSTMSLRDNNGTDDTSPTFKLIEDGSDVLSIGCPSREVHQALE